MTALNLRAPYAPRAHGCGAGDDDMVVRLMTCRARSRPPPPPAAAAAAPAAAGAGALPPPPQRRQRTGFFWRGEWKKNVVSSDPLHTADCEYRTA